MIRTHVHTSTTRNSNKNSFASRNARLKIFHHSYILIGESLKILMGRTESRWHTHIWAAWYPEWNCCCPRDFLFMNLSKVNDTLVPSPPSMGSIEFVPLIGSIGFLDYRISFFIIDLIKFQRQANLYHVFMFVHKLEKQIHIYINNQNTHLSTLLDWNFKSVRPSGLAQKQYTWHTTYQPQTTYRVSPIEFRK